MPLTVGQRLGPYEVVAAIGAGGMGEVYRAHDTKLGRDVALKTLPDAFAHDAERLARFEREARTLAALNHPNIAAIYGIEGNALVMELVPGEDLAHRIARGPVPVAEALPIARQIADALEAAHEAGIIHRDSKPANIKMRDDGTVKVLDFGLSRALASESDPRPEDRSTSPTVLSPAMTAMGVILGTAAYMSPEQAKGRPADRRADVWAFGVVLYEMLAGRRLFDAPDVSETLAAVLTTEPKWDALPPETPTGVRRLLPRCLAKDRRRRLDSLGAARLDLDEAMTSGPETAAQPYGVARGLTGALIVASLLVGALASHWLWPSDRTLGNADLRPVVTSITAAPDSITAFVHGFALSPDAATLVYSGRGSDGRRRLWRRPLADVRAEEIQGTDGGSYPFWSPDGRDVAFFAEGRLKRVPIAGGPAQNIADAPGPWPYGSWAPNGILFSLSQTRGTGIHLVGATGGQPSKLPIDGAVFDPQWLPDGKHFLYIDGNRDRARILAASIDGREPPVAIQELDQGVTASASSPGFQFSDAGFLVFNNAGVLSLRRFDAATLKADGPLKAIGDKAGTPRAWFAVSVAGSTLAALNPSVAAIAGTPGDPIARLQWVDRSGRTVGQLGAAGRYWTLQLSHDGQRAIVNPDDSIWALDVRTNLKTRVASAAGAVWLPDGQTIIYRDETGLWIKAATGEGQAHPLLKFASRTLVPTAVSRQGTLLLATARATLEQRSLDIWQVSLPDGVDKPLVATDAEESQATFSPDGGWIAYAANPTGRFEIYVRRVSGDSPAVRMSVDGGEHPMWPGDGHELFFLSPTDEIVAVDVSALSRTGQPGNRHVLFRVVTNDIVRESFAPYAVAPDGQRFLINTPASPEPLTLMQHVGG